MAETKEELAAERDALRVEIEQLRGQLSAATGRAPGVAAPAHTFQLSEGDRAELEARGVATIGGRLMTRDDVAAELADNQVGVDLGDGPVVALPPAGTTPRGAVPGVDFIYPSVAPGLIDPAVAGTPGINGPAAAATGDPDGGY